jgi:FAD/FMN-containing dehydrogenase
MGLLRDWHYIERATEIPALSEMIREALIRALFTRNDRVLTPGIIGDLTRAPAVTVKIKDDGEVRKLLQVLNGEESTVSLGLNAEDYNYFRTQLGVGKDREIGVTVRPRTLLTYDWIVPEQRGVQLDFSGYTGIEFPEGGDAAIAKVGTPWKRLYDEAMSKGYSVPFVPTVPLDFAVGDGFWGDAPFGSYAGEFLTHVNALRAINAYGHRTRIGFEQVPNNGTAYDLLRGMGRLSTEFLVPVEAAFRLQPKLPARKTITYTFDDAAKLSTALDRLARSALAPTWVHITDQAAALTLRPGAAEAFTVQVSISGTAAGAALREKALDTALTGSKAKVPDVANPFDVSADVYGRTAGRVEQGLFVGEVRIPASAFSDFVARLRVLAQQSASKASVYATLRSTGTLSIFPSFDHPKERPHLYDISKGVAKVVEQIRGGVFVSRLAHLWSEEPGYAARMAILREIKLRFDTAHVIEPLIAP